MLVCHDVASEINFCKVAFGAVELARRSTVNGSIVHATLRIGQALIMVHDDAPSLLSCAPQPDGSSPVVIYVYVKAVDAIIERATYAGAKVLIPATNQYWGDRVGRIIDPAGHVWNVASKVMD
jgi:PhnB protein